MSSDPTPRFSILLPTHRSPDTLRLAIASLLDQTLQDFEVLIVLDGVEDDTRAVVGSFCDPRLRVFDLPKAPGFGYANRNIALKDARGDLIAFMADDDLVTPDHLARMEEPFSDPSVRIAFSAPVWVSPRGHVLPEPFDLADPSDLDAFRTKRNFFPAAAVVHRRSALDTCGAWPEDGAPAGDWDLWLRILEGGRSQSFSMVDTVTALHFRAARRTGFSWAPASVLFLEELAETATWWPQILSVECATDSSAQARFHELLRDPNTDFVSDIREGRRKLFSRLARRAVASTPKSVSGKKEISLGNGALPEMRSTTDRALSALGPRGQDLAVQLRETLTSFASDLPLLPGVYGALFNALTAAEAHDAAIALAEASYVSEPDKPWSKLLWIRALEMGGQMHEALALAEELCQEKPGNWQARRIRLSLRLKTGDPAGVVEEYREVFPILVKDTKLHDEAAEAYQALGDDRGALAALKRALDLQPENRARNDAVRNLEARLQTKAP